MHSDGITNGAVESSVSSARANIIFDRIVRSESCNVQVVTVFATKWTLISTRQSFYIIQRLWIRAQWKRLSTSLSANLTIIPLFTALTGLKPAVESAVTRLLVSIKQLLESLTLWSQVRMDEEGVSNVYVQLGNDFNEAVAAFSAFNIDMTYVLNYYDIYSVHSGFTSQWATLSTRWSAKCFRAMSCGRCYPR